jgi:hypothetical protein
VKIASIAVTVVVSFVRIAETARIAEYVSIALIVGANFAIFAEIA